MLKGQVMSDEQKLKISETKKRLFKEGEITIWNKGTKGVMKSWLKGTKGVLKLSPETRKKISDATKGKNNPFYGKHHSEETKEKMGGSNSGSWKGGIYISKTGYRYIYLPEHPRAKCNRVYVAEHILVMEKHLGRYLDGEEVVHHINGNRLDNSIKNLKLFKNNSEHIKFHHKMFK